MSTKSTAQKLLVKPGTSLWVSDSDKLDLIDGLPDDVQLVADPGAASVTVYFGSSESEIRTLLDTHSGSLGSSSLTWVAYPKGGKADINRDSLWPIVGAYGLRPNGQVAIDDTWSALRFRPLKEGEAQFTGGKKS